MSIEKEKLCQPFILKNYSYNPYTGKIYSKIYNKEIGYFDKSIGYKKITININGKNIKFRFHRVAWLLFYGNWPTKEIDHKNQNKLDNRIINLREATKQQNQRNRFKQKNNSSSGFKNVYKNGNKWQVDFIVNKQHKYFGSYKTKEEANEVARKNEKEIYKEYAPTVQ